MKKKATYEDLKAEVEGHQKYVEDLNVEMQNKLTIRLNLIKQAFTDHDRRDQWFKLVQEVLEFLPKLTDSECMVRSSLHALRFYKE